MSTEDFEWGPSSCNDGSSTENPRTSCLFVSPHLDDAVLSCGGALSVLASHDERSVVLSVFAGRPPRKPSLLAREHHETCGLVTHSNWIRRWEDIAACTSLGCAFSHWEYPDALYRYDDKGRLRCQSREDLFCPADGRDEALVGHLTARLADVIGKWRPRAVFGPSSSGSHVDHHVVAMALIAAVSRLSPGARPTLLLYEDMPYALSPAHRHSPPPVAGDASPVIITLAEEDWRHKMAAISAYESQLRMLWDDGEDWRGALRSYAREVGMPLAERVWKVPVAAE